MAGPAAGAVGTLPKECGDPYGQVCDKMIPWDKMMPFPMTGSQIANSLACDTTCDHLIRAWAVVYLCFICERRIYQARK